MTTRELLTNSVPSATIDIVEPGTRARRADYRCVIGRDLKIDPDRLSRYCVRDLDPKVDDLVLLAGAVAFTDRVVPRRPSIAWRRNLEVTVPVHLPEFWNQPELQRQLTGTLDFLTGDNWILDFKPRKFGTQLKPQAKLPLDREVSFVMPYSDGLDSFAVANLVSVGNAAVPLVLVTTGNRRDHAFDKTCAEFRRLAYRVAIPFRLSTRRGRVRHREPSYRSRAFVFGVMAGIAAHLLQAKQIYVAESGQGTFGPWLSPVGNEAADIRMNPLFTRRLSSLLTAILGTEVSHVHPQMWKTKGETLKELRDLNLSDGWWLTWSCSRDQRHISSNHKRIQCGICSGCLLRRQSLNAAGLKSDLDTYLWEDLSAPTLGQSTADHLTVQNDERQAQCAVLDMQLFAGLNSSSSNINAAAQELSSVLNQNADIVESNLRHLISSHAREWEEYRAELGARSFLNRWVDVLK